MQAARRLVPASLAIAALLPFPSCLWGRQQSPPVPTGWTVQHPRTGGVTLFSTDHMEIIGVMPLHGLATANATTELARVLTGLKKVFPDVRIVRYVKDPQTQGAHGIAALLTYSKAGRPMERLMQLNMTGIDGTLLDVVAPADRFSDAVRVLAQSNVAGRPFAPPAQRSASRPGRRQTASGPGHMLMVPRTWHKTELAGGAVSFTSPDGHSGVSFRPIQTRLKALAELGAELRRHIDADPDLRIERIRRDGADANAQASLTDRRGGVPVRESLAVCVRDGHAVVADSFVPRDKPAPLLSREAAKAPDATPLHRFAATDDSFSVGLPADWHVRYASLKQGLSAWSPQGDGFTITMVEVPLTMQTVRVVANGYRWAGIPAPPGMLDLMARAVSPRLAPPDVIRYLYPRIAAGMVQDMNMVEAEPLEPDLARMLAESGAQGALVHYSYTLVPQQGNPIVRAGVPAPLQSREEAHMEAVALVITSASWSQLLANMGLHGASTAGMDFWQATVLNAQAPTATFRRHVGLYRRIADSYRVHADVVAEIAHQDAARVDAITRTIKHVGDMQMRTIGNIQRTTEAVAQGWMYVLGGETPYYSPSRNEIYTLPEAYYAFPSDWDDLREATIADIKRTIPDLAPHVDEP